MPGVGGLAIAGLWYLLLALASPFVALVRRMRGRPADAVQAARITAVAAGMVAALVATSATVGLLMGGDGSTAAQTLTRVFSSGADGLPSLAGLVGVIALILLAVLGLVQLLAAVTRRPRPRPQ